MRLHRVTFSRETLTERDAALLELVLDVAAVAASAQPDPEAVMTFLLARAAQLFPGVVFELGGARVGVEKNGTSTSKTKPRSLAKTSPKRRSKGARSA